MIVSQAFSTTKLNQSQVGIKLIFSAKDSSETDFLDFAKNSCLAGPNGLWKTQERLTPQEV